MELTQLTTWGKKDSTIETIHGEILYYKWCCNEVMRIRKDPARQAKAVSNGDYCAVFVDDVAEHDPHGRKASKAEFPRQYIVTRGL